MNCRHCVFCANFASRTAEFKLGDKLTVEVFGIGEHVDVVGMSKGKGFAGVVKRYHFAGGPKTHGGSDRLRAPGSNGSTTTPGRVYQGFAPSRSYGSRARDLPEPEGSPGGRRTKPARCYRRCPRAKGGLVVVQEARKQ